MPFWPGRKALTVPLVVAVSICALPSRAAQPSPPDDAAIRLDQQVQALKDEALEFAREAQRTEDEVLFPAHSRLSVYLGVKVNGLLLKEVSVTLDDGQTETYTYGDRDAKALLHERNLQRLLRTNIRPGPHRIRVAYTAVWADDDPDDPPVTDVYEAIFDKNQTEAELEFIISRETRVSRPKLSMKQWRPSRS